MKTNPDTHSKSRPLTGAERKAALDKRAKARQRARRAARHERADGWTEPEQRMDVAERVAAHLIKRVELPKYGEPVALTKTDRDEARSAVMLALTSGGFFEHGHLTPRLFRDARNAINARDCLRLQRGRGREILSDDIAATAAAAGWTTECEEITPQLTADQRDTARVICRTLRAARDADTSRKASARYRSNREFFLLTLGILTERTPRALARGAFDTRKSRFLDYLAEGARALRVEPVKHDAAREILRALESRALA